MFDAEWSFLFSACEGQKAMLGKTDLFDHAWGKSIGVATVKDPLYGCIRRFNVYNFDIEGEMIPLAVGEVSNGVFAFYKKES